MRIARSAAIGGTALACLAAIAVAYAGRISPVRKPQPTGFDRKIEDNANKMMEEGQQIFRYDTFGDEDFWGGTLRLHEAIATVSPAAALALGLKVDSNALSPGMPRRSPASSVNRRT